LKEGLRRLTGGKGADIIFDPVGGNYAEAALRSIAWEGRFLVIGFAAGEIPQNAAQSGAAEGLRYPRRVLGCVDAVSIRRRTAPTSRNS